MYKIDLHTHSTASPDGGISPSQYEKAIAASLVDYIAITDHNHIDMAVAMHQQLGDKIIVGEEIMTTVGEVIGLFLTSVVAPNQSIEGTIRAIKAQNGIVYIPHPFETFRHGIHPAILEEIVHEIDIIEVCNGRAFLQDRSAQAVVWARLNQIPGASSSDAHGYLGLGKTFVSTDKQPTRENLVQQIANGKLLTDRPALRTLLYPKYHRIRKKIRKHS